MGNRIKELREGRKWSKEELARRAGTSGQQIGKLERSQRTLRPTWMERLGKAFGVRADELLELDYPVRRVKISGVVQAGAWAEPGEELEYTGEDNWIDVPLPEIYKPLRLFAVKVRGPSMNLVYPEGTVLICCAVEDLMEDPIPGKRYIVRRVRKDGRYEKTVKELALDENGRAWLWPRSSSPEHQAPVTADMSDDGDVISIDAKVLWSLRPD